MQVPLPLAPVIDQTREIPSDVALQISAVYACVELLANTIGTLPLFVYADEGGPARPVPLSAYRFLPMPFFGRR